MTEFLIAENSSINNSVIPLVERDTTIPTKKTTGGEIADQGRKLKLEFVEIDLDKSTVPIGEAEFELPESQFEFTFEIDAARTISFCLTCNGKELGSGQLNNFYFSRSRFTRSDWFIRKHQV